MKKILFGLFVSITVSVNGQFLQSRLLKVNQSNVAEFEASVAQKTKLYNSKEGQPRYITFKILSGPYAQNYIRVQYADEISEFDVIDKVGNDYWFKTTGKLHISEGNRIFSRNTEASYSPKEAQRVNHRRILYYKIKPGMGKHFWRYRTRLVKALEAANWPNRVSTLNCNSGCNGNWVMVRYHHKDFKSEYDDNTKMFPIVVEKYDELFGKNSYEDDSQMLQMSVDENRTRHHQRMPALSSSWN
tara:strand:- start:607 stop:1338 length:732 start_codon:yes stop_codon:yes gene_type:complete